MLLKLLVKTLLVACFFQFISNKLSAEPAQENFIFTHSLKKVGEENNFQNFVLEVSLGIKPGYYVYTDKFEVKITPNENLKIGKKEFPLGTIKYDKFLNRQTTIYTGKNVFKIYFSIPVEKLKGTTLKKLIYVTYQGCSKRICYIPRTLSFNEAFSFESSVKSSSVKIIDRLNNLLKKGFLIALIGAFLTGLLSSLTPCVYPVIPIVVSVIGSQSVDKKLKSFNLSLVFTLGISLLYSAFGILATRSGIILGSFLKSFFAMIIVSAIFFLMGLSLLGLFDLKIPYFLSKKLLKINREGYIGTFLMGMVTGIVAIPCVGPFAISVLTLAVKSSSIVKGFSLLFSFSLGLGVLFIILGTFSSVVANLPKPGLWMIVIKKICGLILLGVSLYYIRLVIPSWLFTIILGATLFFLAWIFRKVDNFNSPNLEKLLKRLAQITSLGGIVVLIGLAISSYLSPSHHGSLSTQSGETIPWLKTEKEALKLASQQGKPVMIDFYANWCPGCLELDRFTFRDNEVVSKAKEFITLRVDLTREDEESTIVANKYSVLGLPTILFLNPNGEAIKDFEVSGYVDSRELVQQMEKVLKRIKGQ